MSVIALSTFGRLTYRVRQACDADPRFILGSLTGLAGAWFVTGEPSEHGVGLLLWLVSNVTFIHLWLRQLNPWMLAMQAAYLITTARGLVRVYGDTIFATAQAAGEFVSRLL